MELHLQRTYLEDGTNGELILDDEIICYTIELPWRGNRKGLSCIPEGRYSLETRYSPHHGNHLLVEKVPGRSAILIHPANNALLQLQGCIAPVSRITGSGTGTGSKLACRLVKEQVYNAIRSGDRVWLTIYSQQNKNNETVQNNPGNNKTTGARWAFGWGAFKFPYAKVL